MGHEWIPVAGRGLECSRCLLFVSEDGRAWATRRVFEDEWARQLPAMRKSYVETRVTGHVYAQAADSLLGAVQSYLEEQGFEPQKVPSNPPAFQVRSKPAKAGDQQIYVVATVTEVEPGRAKVRIQQHTLTPGFVTRFDTVRAIQDELALAERLDEGAVRAFEAEAEQVFQPHV